MCPTCRRAGEMVLFDRSWYNRAGVEHVMGFCTHEEYTEFLRSVPEFEKMLIRSGTILIKFWFSVSDEEQERRFRGRIEDRTKRWKLSPMDLESRKRWFDYSQAKDAMFLHTDIPESPWWVVNSDDKKRARLNAMSHLLSMIPYHEVEQPTLKLPRRQKPDLSYVRPPIESQRWVPARYSTPGSAADAVSRWGPRTSTSRLRMPMATSLEWLTAWTMASPTPRYIIT